jgi:hypothetical protein
VTFCCFSTAHLRAYEALLGGLADDAAG